MSALCPKQGNMFWNNTLKGTDVLKRLETVRNIKNRNTKIGYAILVHISKTSVFPNDYNYLQSFSYLRIY